MNIQTPNTKADAVPLENDDGAQANLPVIEPRSSDPDSLASEIVEKLTYRLGKNPKAAKEHDWLQAVIAVIRDRAIDSWLSSGERTRDEGGRRIYYLSLEFLIGRLMRDAASNLELIDNIREALTQLDVSLDVIAELEPDAALGNGGLGRLAACFMESMASVDVPAFGYGIRYENGLFRQEIHDGWQVELPENWLAHGNPWEFERQEYSYEVGFGGLVELRQGEDGQQIIYWKSQERVVATAYDTPIVGWRGKRVNTLRLWSAKPIDPILLDKFNAGDHVGALEESNRASALARVLYPADSSPAGQELRLRQEYFFSSASLQDIIRRHLNENDGNIHNFADKVAVQLNDTHPAVGVAELMRLLVDVHQVDFDEAWEITRSTFCYTNHTLLPEALESWPLPLFERLLPRNMQLVYAINAKLLSEARRNPNISESAIAEISIIDEHAERRVRMGNLAFAGSHSVNGVSALHTELMKETVFSTMHQLYPNRINNKTNGVTFRRWFMQCNPGLFELVRETIGDAFMDDAEALRELDKFAEDSSFQEKFHAVKRDNKVALSNMLQERMGMSLDPDALYDVQIKRIHEYKRQLLNIIEAISLYDQIRSHPEKNWTPRIKIFAGKAAPSYHTAKVIIKLANDVARVINQDPTVQGLLKVVFAPNYTVSMAERLIPAADLSEQISTAGMEASGTGNMKFALNGALTIGTLDGANVEICEHVGADNIYIFGLKADEVANYRAHGHNPRQIIESSRELSQALNAIASGVFSPDDPNRYNDLVGGLYDHDWFMVAADFDSYADKQRVVDADYGDQANWRRKAILNTARSGWFSSDRTIRQYANELWNIPA